MREINRKKTEKDILREEKIKKNSEEKFEESERRNREREEKKEAKVELDSENGKYILTLEQ